MKGLKPISGLIIFGLMSIQGVFAQVIFKNWAEDKTIGVYLSRKEFGYTQEWLQLLNQFTQSGGADVPREDLKLASLVRLGLYLKQELAGNINGTRVVFLNEVPDLSSAWLKVKNAEPGSVSRFTPTGLDTLDFIISVDKMILSAYPEKSVYSVSNQIRTEKRWVYQGEAHIRITDAKNQLLMPPVLLHLHSDREDINNTMLNFDNAHSTGGRLLAGLFSGLLQHPVR